MEKRVPSEIKNPHTSFGIKSIDINNQGAKLFFAGNYDEALKAFENATTVVDHPLPGQLGLGVQFLSDNNFEVAWFNKANTLAKLRRYEEAIKAFDRAIELNPRSESISLRQMTNNILKPKRA